MDCTDVVNADILNALLNMKSPENGLLLVVTTCQTETSALDPFQQFRNRLAGKFSLERHPTNGKEQATHNGSILDAAFEKSSRVTFLPLSPLSREDAFHWTFEKAESLHFPKDKILYAANVIYEKSGGNPRRMRYLFCYLSLENERSPLTTETLDALRVHTSDSKHDLFVTIIQQQSSHVRAVVDLVAALAECGELEIDCKIIDMLLQRPSMNEIQIALE